METEELLDRGLIRAARSLHTNRAMQLLIEGRIQCAARELTTYLALAGLTSARIGAFVVELEGDDLRLTYHPAPRAHQLPLPETASDAALDQPSLLGIFADEDPSGGDTWATPATRVVGDWLSEDPDALQVIEQIVRDAGDVFTGAVKLHAWVFEQMRQHLASEGDEVFLGHVLSTVDWTAIAAYAAPIDDWEPLTCRQQDVVQALLPPRHFLWPDGGNPAVDIDSIRARAQAGELPCPHCNHPLAAHDFDLLGAPMLRLSCACCSFEEF